MRRVHVLLLAAALLLAAPATAKEGVRAELIEPVDLTAPAGTRTTVRWRLEDAEGNPFGAGGIYLRVRRCGSRKPLRIAAGTDSGPFSATFRMPRRGLRRVTVGLEGWRVYPSGRQERADATFRFDPPLRRRCG